MSTTPSDKDPKATDPQKKTWQAVPDDAEPDADAETEESTEGSTEGVVSPDKKTWQ
jgi:hypothetical protein